MKQTLMVVTVLILLALPMMAGADDQGWLPPEWTPTPPAQQTIDLAQTGQAPRANGVLTNDEYGQSTMPASPSSAQQERSSVWTWSEIERDPVRSTGGD
jgi:hypothetical protein